MGPEHPSPEEVENRELLDQFESGTLPEASFHHTQHVRAAWLCLREHPPVAALARFCAALQRLAAAYGKEGLYHETITWAYLFLIRERMGRSPTASWSEFAAANADLLTWSPSALAHYYRPETLASELARRVFVLPDRLSS